MKIIEKKSVVPLPQATGSIFDTTNISDKTKNTYSANIIDGLLNGGKVKVKTLDTTPITYSDSSFLVTDIPMKNTSILSIFCKNRFGFNLIPLQYKNVSSDKWVITDVNNSLTGTFSLTIVYFEFDNDINIFA